MERSDRAGEPPATGGSVPHIEREIAEQPDVLARVAHSLCQALPAVVVPASHRRVHFVGCGDMHFAAESAAWFARREPGLEARAWRSMDLRWVGDRLGSEDLVICASISGRTPRTLEAARIAQRAGARTLGLTDNPDSAFARELDETVLLGTSPVSALDLGPYPGYHHQIAQTKTFTAALLAEMLIACRLAGKDGATLEPVVSSLATGLPGLSESVRSGAPRWLAGRRRVEILASGPHLPLACYGAAKLLEYAVPAHAQCLEEFNHLEMFLADDATLVVVLAPDEASWGRAGELLAAWERLGVKTVVLKPAGEAPGERTVVVPMPPAGSPVTPFLLALFLQLLAYRAAVAVGRDPDLWLGGVRTDLILEASQRTVRGSRVAPPPGD